MTPDIYPFFENPLGSLLLRSRRFLTASSDEILFFSPFPRGSFTNSFVLRPYFTSCFLAVRSHFICKFLGVRSEFSAPSIQTWRARQKQANTKIMKKWRSIIKADITKKGRRKQLYKPFSHALELAPATGAVLSLYRESIIPFSLFFNNRFLIRTALNISPFISAFILLLHSPDRLQPLQNLRQFLRRFVWYPDLYHCITSFHVNFCPGCKSMWNRELISYHLKPCCRLW